MYSLTTSVTQTTQTSFFLMIVVSQATFNEALEAARLSYMEKKMIYIVVELESL
jgi:hypothetical protein